MGSQEKVERVIGSIAQSKIPVTVWLEHGKSTNLMALVNRLATYFGWVRSNIYIYGIVKVLQATIFSILETFSFVACWEGW